MIFMQIHQYTHQQCECWIGLSDMYSWLIFSVSQGRMTLCLWRAAPCLLPGTWTLCEGPVNALQHSCSYPATADTTFFIPWFFQFNKYDLQNSSWDNVWEPWFQGHSWHTTISVQVEDMAALEKQKSSRSLGTVEYIIKCKSIFSEYCTWSISSIIICM